MKNKIINRLESTGLYVYKYKNIYLLLLVMVSCFEIYMIYSLLSSGKVIAGRYAAYLTSYILLLSSSIIAGVVMAITVKKKNAPVIYSIITHVYCLFIVAWSTLISCCDMMKGNYPIVYFTIIMTVGGVAAISPIVFVPLVLLSLPFIITYAWFNKDLVSFANTGGTFNIVVFILMAIIIGIRLYYVTILEAKYKSSLKESLVTDPLTNLGNERKYIDCIEHLDLDDSSYAVVMMDLNNLKKTNDTYGHHYGCHLVVEVGHILPTIFPNSELFHIGGDEFVAVLKDVNSIDEYVKNFKSRLEYTHITFEGVCLILSVAIGVAVRGKDENYIQVYNRADKNMYEHKNEIKTKYNFMEVEK